MKLELPLTELSEIMKACSCYVSADSDSISSFIQLKCRHGVCFASASDNRKARAVTVHYIDGDDGIYYIPVLKAAKPKPFNDTAIIETDGKTTTVTMGSISAMHNIPAGNFIDIEKHLSFGEPEYQCIFEVGNLLDALKGFNRKHKIYIVSHGAMKLHILKKLDCDGDFALVAPCSISKREETDDA
jgi:hypothetical protein